ncbi:MAG: hypothetical protein AB2L14_12525 [Candidatus Xenobiia bacterium LiM19]
MTGITDLNTAAQTSYLSSQYARTSGNSSSPKAGTLSPQPFDTFEQSDELEEEEMEGDETGSMPQLHEEAEGAGGAESPAGKEQGQGAGGTEGAEGQQSDPPSALKQTLENGITTITATKDTIAPYRNLVDSMCSSFDADGNQTEMTDRQKKMMAVMLSSYDISTLQNLQAEGVHINICDDSDFQERQGGGYQPSTKQIGLRASQFSDDTPLNEFTEGLMSGRHELGHGIDDMLSPDSEGQATLQSYSDKQLVDMCNSYRNRVDQDSSQRWDGYKWDMLNPTEYLAEGFEMYESTEETKDMLSKMDPDLYAYVENMLQTAAAHNQDQTPAA